VLSVGVGKGFGVRPIVVKGVLVAVKSWFKSWIGFEATMKETGSISTQKKSSLIYTWISNLNHKRSSL